MPTPIQLLCTDFDGTLHSDFTHPRVPLALQEKVGELQAANTQWIINTGRTLDDLRYGLEEANLTVHPDYVVVVEREIYQCVNGDYKPHSQWNKQCATTQAALFAQVADRLPELFSWVNERFEAQVYEDSWSPFCLIARNNTDADEVQKYVNEQFSDEPMLSFVRNDIYARLSHTGYTKGTTLTEIARLLNIPREGILTAGDHWNDLSMLQPERARWIIAPYNAITEVAQHVEAVGGFLASRDCGDGVLEGLEWALNND
tara:strand:- start:335 stop:1111 length:777 start_codon:yes stop_codon:yes gene_type:complete